MKTSWFGLIALGLVACAPSSDDVATNGAELAGDSSDTQSFSELTSDQLTARSKELSKRFGDGWFAWPTAVGLLERAEFNLLPDAHATTTRAEKELLARKFVADKADVLALTRPQIDQLTTDFDPWDDVLLTGTIHFDRYADLRVSNSDGARDLSAPESLDRVIKFRFSTKDTAQILWFADESRERYLGEPTFTPAPVHAFCDSAVLQPVIAAATQVTVCNQIQGQAPPWALPPVTIVDLGKITEDEVRAAVVEPFVFRTSTSLTLAYRAEITHQGVTWKAAFSTRDGHVLWRGDTFCEK